MDPINYAAEKPHPAPGAEQAERRFAQAASAPGVLERSKAQLTEWNLEWPGWARGIITLAVSVAIGAGIVVSGGALASAFVAAAATFTAIPFFLWMAAVIAWLTTIWFGGQLMFKVAKYFLSKHVDHDLARLRDGVAHALTPSPKPQHG